MSQTRCKDTKLEMIVRNFLHSKGLGFWILFLLWLYS
ncbi:MAG: hypothetical protein JW723_07015 [Bacteroidales bacterium]|nr:hypothetical protein [Bacteroidales bacterium]